EPGGTRQACGRAPTARYAVAHGRTPGRPLYRDPQLPIFRRLAEWPCGLCGEGGSRRRRGGRGAAASAVAIDSPGHGGAASFAVEWQRCRARSLHRFVAIEPGVRKYAGLAPGPAVLRSRARTFAW